MMSSNGNIFRVTGHLCGEFTGPRWIPRTKASDAELWCFLWSPPWINGRVNNREAGDLRRYRTHYDVTVMRSGYVATEVKHTNNIALQWRHNDHDGVSNHQPHGCLLNRLFRRRSKKTSKLRVTGLCVGNSPGPVNSPHKGRVTRKMFPFDDAIMESCNWLMDDILYYRHAGFQFVQDD